MVRLEATDTSAFLAVGVNQGGCGIASANKGVYGIINSNDQWTVTSDLGMLFIAHTWGELLEMVVIDKSLICSDSLLGGWGREGSLYLCVSSINQVSVLYSNEEEDWSWHTDSQTQYLV